MVTPFSDDGSMDREQAKDLVEVLIEDGVDDLVSSTGSTIWAGIARTAA